MGWEKMLGSQAKLGVFFCRHCGYLAIAIFNVKDKHHPENTHHNKTF
jgi:hypothetical protein